MEITKIPVSDNLEELIQRGTPEFPMEIYYDDLEKYVTGCVDWHWHKDIQMQVVIEGEAKVYAGNRREILKEGEGVFYNSNVLHRIAPHNNTKAKLYTIVFKPEIISGGYTNKISRKYVAPYLENKDMSVIVLKNEANWEKRVTRMIKGAYILCEEKNFGWELETRNLLSLCWINIIKNTVTKDEGISLYKKGDEDRIKKAVGFILKNFDSSIDLEDIAEAANICKSECCRCFKRCLDMTPIEYLNKRRVYEAAKMLIETDLSISDITQKSGFSSQSYFSAVFKKETGKRPIEFRNNKKSKKTV